MRRCLVLLALAGGLAGCVRLHVAPPPVRNYRLDYPAPHIDGAPLPVVLRVTPFAVAAVYDREPIVYREGPYAVGNYFESRWSANPGSMIADLLARDLSDSGLYRVVERAPTVLGGDYQINGEIEEIEEDGTTSGCTAHLRLRLSVLRLRAPQGGSVLLQHTYAADHPAPCNQPPLLVASMSAALAKLSAELQGDVYTAIAADTRGAR